MAHSDIATDYKTFRGGIHPPYNKELANSKPIEAAPVPARVYIPLSQHIGAPNSALVAAGEKVSAGQKIGGTDAFVSAPVHSSVSGTVAEVGEVANFTGARVPCVIIDADANQVPFAPTATKPLDSLTPEEIRDIAKEAGLVGMGGAAFPTHVKLAPPKDKPVDIVLINACECEPFLTCDHRLMLERPADLVGGLRLLLTAVGAGRGVIGIEANKPDAIEAVKRVAGDIEVATLPVKYPEGAEKMLISVVAGRKVPPGKLPSEVGALVQNVGTAVALFDAASTGKPLFERVLTVTGPGIRNPKNLLAKIGTPVSTLIEAAGGFVGTPSRLIMGGPMTGWAQENLDAPIQKGTSGIVALTAELQRAGDEAECVRCGKCVEACPMYLMPNAIVKAAKRSLWAEAEKWGALDCFECGCCSFSCPSLISHVKYVRKAKAEIAALKKK